MSRPAMISSRASRETPAGGSWTKRAIDLLLAAMGLLVLSPLLILASLVVLLSMGRPILFRHVRPGLGERPFTLLKFRTMRELYDASRAPLPEPARITRAGKILRVLSIDELPQLWNVLKGDMSFVGPRPLLLEYLPYYTERERKRHLVRPGITGLAQIKGRNLLPWDERLEADVFYVENCSLSLDLRILWSTLGTVFVRSGIVVVPGTTQEKLSVERRRRAEAPEIREP